MRMMMKNFFERLSENFDDLNAKQTAILLVIGLLVVVIALIGLTLVPEPVI